jgi:eukaryotic-like serine/threonine-protein kinase
MSTRRISFGPCLGAGGFGEVYLAQLITSGGLQQQVAVKTLHGQAGWDDDHTRRLRDEARLLAALNHRAILHVHDLVVVGGRVGLVAEYVAGQDVEQVIRTTGALPARVALEVVGEVAGALDAALSTIAPDSGQPMALVHRDIKPANIRLSESGGVKLLDFGIAVSSEIEREAKTGTGLIVGTAGYLAPDRLTREGVLPASDIYALGCVLYEAITGEMLYADVSKGRMMLLCVNQDAHDPFIEKRLQHNQALLGDEVTGLLRELLAFEPEDRPTAAALERRCDELSHRTEGPHLRRWARERHWPPMQPRPGVLQGRELEVSALFGDSGGAVPVHPTAAPYSGPVSGPVSGDVGPQSTLNDVYNAAETARPPSGAAGTGPSAKAPARQPRRSQAGLWAGVLVVVLVVGGGATALGLGGLGLGWFVAQLDPVDAPPIGGDGGAIAPKDDGSGALPPPNSWPGNSGAASATTKTGTATGGSGKLPGSARGQPAPSAHDDTGGMTEAEAAAEARALDLLAASSAPNSGTVAGRTPTSRRQLAAVEWRAGRRLALHAV